MDAIQELTAGCVRFAERKKVKPEKDFVTFGKDEQCSAQLGRVGGRQDITFTSECLKDRGSVQRYLLRTLGLPYEHTRLDRDKYIVVNSDNILPDHRSEFEKHAGPTFGLPYDYLSVLHCGINEYAIDKLFPTVVPLLSRTPLGKSSNLSPSDVAKLSQLYSCNNS
ncbi:high choriolytic enzyme 1-like [Paramacrobiotus metropolitanus]|uniref:high choriolytic enzyme 1-like n=1 Tax=Paramacrobiotus metropolitanus TaxID=2943436 RepID=UPI002445BD8C|nr:high choriolytic enzyme 1-like [Paramacrobiotus metropolitanus]